MPLTTWFLAIYPISQAKTGLSALALIHHKLMQVMGDREERYVLDRKVQVDDSYLAAFCYRFNLRTLHQRLLVAAANPRLLRSIRIADVYC